MIVSRKNLTIASISLTNQYKYTISLPYYTALTKPYKTDIIMLTTKKESYHEKSDNI